MKDKQLGTLHRSPPIPHWSGTIDLPVFLAYGTALIEPKGEKRKAGADDEELLAAQAKVNEMFSRMLKSVPPEFAELVRLGMPPAGPRRATRRGKAKPKAGPKAEAGELFDPGDPFDADRPFRRGRFRLCVHDRSGKGRPTDAQRRAYTWLKSGQEEIGRRVVEAIFREYQETYPARLKWWGRWHGHRAGDRPPPELRSPDDLKEMIRLRIVYLQEKPAAEGLPYVGLQLDAVWEPRDGIGVIVHKDGTLVLGNSRLPEDPYRAPRRVTNRVFGELRRGRQDRGWETEVRMPFFEDYADAAGRLPSGRRYQQFRGPEGELPALFLKGLFELSIEDRGSEGPSPAQEQAFEQFRRNEAIVCRSVLQLIYDHYHTFAPHWRDGDYIDRRDEKVLAPRIDGPEGLRRLIRLDSILVLDDRGRDTGDGPVPLLLSFRCAWDEEHGLAVGVTGDEVELVE